MVKVKENLVGRRFGKLVVIKQVEDYITPSGIHVAQWLCQCDCGKTTIVLGGSLKRNHTKSCGCLIAEKAKETFATHHGSYDKLYRVRLQIIDRCYNTKNKRYKDYGGRGIKVCEEWLNNYEAFKEWAINTGYKEGLSIDRKNNDGNYCPENCRWVTSKIQSNNIRSNHYVEYNGKRQTVAEWADELGINYDTLFGRLFTKKWDVEKALSTPVQTQYGRKNNEAS